MTIAAVMSAFEGFRLVGQGGCRYHPVMDPLSESAVAALRFEIKGWRPKDNRRRLPAYRELAAAGIMEPVEDEYRFTPWGMEHRKKS